MKTKEKIKLELAKQKLDLKTYGKSNSRAGDNDINSEREGYIEALEWVLEVEE